MLSGGTPQGPLLGRRAQGRLRLGRRLARRACFSEQRAPAAAAKKKKKNRRRGGGGGDSCNFRESRRGESLLHACTHNAPEDSSVIPLVRSLRHFCCKKLWNFGTLQSQFTTNELLCDNLPLPLFRRSAWCFGGATALCARFSHSSHNLSPTGDVGKGGGARCPCELLAGQRHCGVRDRYKRKP